MKDGKYAKYYLSGTLRVTYSIKDNEFYGAAICYNIDGHKESECHKLDDNLYTTITYM